MDTDLYYDIPIYKTLPTIIRNNEYSKEKEKIKLYDISIEKIYQSEPFSNYRNNHIIILFFIIIIIFLFKFFYSKKI
jgi:hypothetical protein